MEAAIESQRQRRDIGPRISWTHTQNNFLEEVAKYRAYGGLGQDHGRALAPKGPASMMLRTHVQPEERRSLRSSRS